MKKFLFGISVAAFFITGSVWAEDGVQSHDESEVASVAATTVFSWNGSYIGGQLGGSWGNSTISSNIEAGTFIIPPMVPLPLISGHLLDFSPDSSGFVGGFHAGHNFDIGNNVIIGLETDFVLSNVDTQTGYQAFDMNPLNGNNGGFLNARTNIDQKWAGATRVRVGYAMNRFLPYVSAGLAYGKVETSANAYLSATALGPNAYGNLEYNFRNSDIFTGWTLGAGAEYAATDNILLRLEYRYVDYGSETYRHVIPGNGTSAINYTVNHETHDLRLGVAYKF